MRNLWLRLTLAWYAFWFPSIATTIQRINYQLVDGTRMGVRGTPVISFWKMRPKWKLKGNYWESESQDGDFLMGNGVYFYPDKYRLVYFKIPNTELVCQLAFEKEKGKATAWDDNGQTNYVSGKDVREALLAKAKHGIHV